MFFIFILKARFNLRSVKSSSVQCSSFLSVFCFFFFREILMPFPPLCFGNLAVRVCPRVPFLGRWKGIPLLVVRLLSICVVRFCLKGIKTLIAISAPCSVFLFFAAVLCHRLALHRIDPVILSVALNFVITCTTKVIFWSSCPCKDLCSALDRKSVV